MFFRKKKTDKELFRQQATEQLKLLAEGLREGKEVLAVLCKEVQQKGAEISRDISRDISRHNLALEDCLDMLEEWKRDRESEMRQRRDMEKERENLLSVFHTYQGHLWNMKAYAEENDSVWYQQLLLVEKEAQERMLSGGITAIDQMGCAVDYELHEVIEIRDTEDAGKDKTVAAIYSPGYLYQGRVWQKARVVAYRLRNTTI